jgi:DNA polymerase III epsilon subunit-like protein
MLLALEAADRLARSLSDGGPLPAREAARSLFALSGGPVELAVAILDTVVVEDVRLERRGESIGLAATPWADVPLQRARFAVIDLETTGFVARSSRITEAAVVRLEGDGVVDELELAGSDCAPGDLVATLLAAADDSVLVGHNVRFDVAFLDHELSRLGSRIAAPVLDTLVLARRLLAGRAERLTLAALAEFFGTSARPVHRALPDARTAAEVFSALLALARDAGARTVADLSGLCRPRDSRQVRGGR